MGCQQNLSTQCCELYLKIETHLANVINLHAPIYSTIVIELICIYSAELDNFNWPYP